MLNMSTPSFDALIQSLTLKKMEKIWMHNLAENLPTIRKAHDISEIPKQKGKSALVIGAGPSIKYVNLKFLRKWNGIVICADRMLLPLLKMRVKPFASVSVDGSEKIADFYKDPFVQRRMNKVKAVLSCQTTHPSVSAVIPLESQYYFTSIWDDPFAEMSITRIFHELTEKTMMATDGNAGSCAFQLALYLESSPIGLIGIDFCYDELDPLKTTYQETFRIISGGDPQKFLSNYRTGTTWAGKQVLTDIMFLTYYKILVPQIEIAEKNGTTTHNLGEYSILPAEKVKPMNFEKFLKDFPA